MWRYLCHIQNQVANYVVYSSFKILLLVMKHISDIDSPVSKTMIAAGTKSIKSIWVAVKTVIIVMEHLAVTFLKRAWIFVIQPLWHFTQYIIKKYIQYVSEHVHLQAWTCVCCKYDSGACAPAGVEVHGTDVDKSVNACTFLLLKGWAGLCTTVESISHGAYQISVRSWSRVVQMFTTSYNACKDPFVRAWGRLCRTAGLLPSVSHRTASVLWHTSEDA